MQHSRVGTGSAPASDPLAAHLRLHVSREPLKFVQRHAHAQLRADVLLLPVLPGRRRAAAAFAAAPAALAPLLRAAAAAAIAVAAGGGGVG